MAPSASATAPGKAQQKQTWLSTWLAALLSVRYVQQSLILTWKNLLVAWRNRRATLLRLMAPFVFLLLALVIQLALDANSRRQERIREADPPPLIPINPLPSCHDDLYIAGRSCVNFLYSPNNSAIVQDIIANIRERNKPAMTPDQVLGFASRGDSDDWMAANPESTLGAVHFIVNEAASPPSIQYSIQTNTTTKAFKGNFQSPVTFFTMPLASAVAREVSRVQLAAAGGEPEDLSWNPQLAPFPHPQLRSIGMVGYVLGPFIFAACMFGMVMQLGAVVGEKEVGLVTALRLMGLRQSAYWTSWVVADLLLGFMTALSIVLWGLIMQFRFFLRNDFGVLLLLFWLFTLALSSFSYFLSTFMSRAQSATYTGFAVFLIGWICQTVVVFGVPYDPETYFAPSGVGRTFFWIFALLPWCPLSKGTQDLAAATNSDKSPGLRWSQRESYCQYIPDSAQWPAVDPTQQYVDFTCVFPISQCYITLIVQALGWLALAIYLDNVLPGPNKRARSPWYFLLPSYWMRTRGARGGLSTHQQQQLLKSATAAQQQGAVQGAGANVPKHPAALQGGGNAVGVQQQQQQQDARLDMSGSNAGSSTDGDVAAEEMTMQALLQELLPVAAAAAAAHGSNSASGVRATAPSHLQPTISWPELQTAPSRPQLQSGNSVKPGLREVSRSSPSSSVDADCQLVDGQGETGEGSSGWDFAGYAIAVLGLKKVFKAGLWARTCGGAKDFHALRGVWLGIRPGQLFALLGPIGAGKTTMINCLTGLLAPSSGEMLLCGESILTEGGLDRATGLIGVCPQFDVLWGELTGVEHLLVAGHVKGLPWAEVSGAAESLLTRVQLQGSRGVRSSAYSGGMKRRLSVAVALVGDPKVLFLDEPTTGMDPISRRAVWDVIQEAKQGRAVVLTTHSMEEADILGDRIGIVARGRLRALGSSIRLKQKFGTGYQVLVSLLHDGKSGSSSSSSSSSNSRHTPSLRQRRTSAPKQRQDPAAAAAAGGGGHYSGAGSPLSSPRGNPALQQQQWPDLSPRCVVVGQVSAQVAPLQLPSSIPEEAESHSSRHSSPRRSRETLPGSPRSAAGGIGGASVGSAARTAVKQLFAAYLDGLVPSEENRRSMQFLVPRAYQQQLVGLLQQLEAATAAGSSDSGSSVAAMEVVSDEGIRAISQGVADVQLCLTSLEEVFLSIAKKAELEASAESGATVTITLPDTGRQIEVAVGQDWVQDALGTPGAEVTSGEGAPTLPLSVGGVVRTYFVKWVQDESGALAVLEVTPAVGQQQQQGVPLIGRYSGGAGAAVAPVAY